MTAHEKRRHAMMDRFYVQLNKIPDVY